MRNVSPAPRDILLPGLPGWPRRKDRTNATNVAPTMRRRTMCAGLVWAVAASFSPVTAGLARAADAESAPTAVPDASAPNANDRALVGRPLVYVEEPPLNGRPACSTRWPLCVHAPKSVPGARVLEVLASAERAWSTLQGALGLPSPDVDPDTLVYAVHLVEGEGPGATHLRARDVRSRVDRAGAFTVFDAEVPSGCALDQLTARAIARASLYRVAPATDEATALAQTTYLAGLVAPCFDAPQRDAVRTFQAHPDRAVTSLHAGDAVPVASATPAPPAGRPKLTRENLLHAEGASLFWARVDGAFGRAPGGIVRATWALAPTMTPLGAPRWDDEPDGFDVLRVSFDGALSHGSKLADLFLDVAVARAFMGSADDGTHAVETRAFGDDARITLDWDLPWPTKPKRVAPRAPVEPTGASYVVIRRSGARPDARLRVEITWEEHALFRWAIVKRDARGAELGRVVIPTTERATDAQLTLADFGGADSLLLVGVNAGDPAYAFDPDDEVWEPHGWLLTIAEE